MQLSFSAALNAELWTSVPGPLQPSVLAQNSFSAKAVPPALFVPVLLSIVAFD